MHRRAAVRAAFGLACAFEPAGAIGHLLAAGGIAKLQVGQLHALPYKHFGRGGSIIQREENLFATPVGHLVFHLRRHGKGQLALCGGLLQHDISHVGRPKAFVAVYQAAAAGHQAGEFGNFLQGFGGGQGEDVLVARFGEPAVAAVFKLHIPFVPHAGIVFGLQAADDGKRAVGKCAGGADLQRAEVLQQSGIAAAVDDACALAHQEAVAETAHQRNRRGRMRVHGRAAAGAVGFK